MITDLTLQGGMIIDGTGQPARRGDLVIRDGRIAEAKETTGRVLDVSGKIVCPGFVDLHTHSDLTLLSNPDAPSKVRQGVTTEVVGNCGLGPAPLTPAGDRAAIRAAVAYLDLDPDVAWTWQSMADYLDVLHRSAPAVNVATLVGQLPLHATTAGFGAAPPTARELREMQVLLAESLDEGAIGMSTGLVYAPLTTVSQAELITLAQVIADREALFSWHLRSYDDDLYGSVDQAVRVAERSGCRTQISHLAAVGRRNWPVMRRALDRIDRARESGARIGIDIYPYLHGNCPMAQLLPGWAQEGAATEWVPRLRDAGVRRHVIDDWADRAVGWDEVTINVVPGLTMGEPIGRTVAEAAARVGMDGDAFALDLLAEHGTGVMIVAGGRSEEVLRSVLDHPATVIASDGLALDASGQTGRGVPHPRSYGCFPRYLSRYVAEDEAAWVDAIARCTGRPAAIAGLNRGVLAPGRPADVVVIDKQRLSDRATFDEPQTFPDGIDLVVVNGEPVLEEGRSSGARPGQILMSTRHEREHP